MRGPAWLMIGCLLLAACSNALSRQAPAPSTPEGEASVLVAQVNHALMSAGVEGYAGLRISAADGAVTIEGSLATQQLIDRAVEIARGVDGVKQVVYRATEAR